MSLETRIKAGLRTAVDVEPASRPASVSAVKAAAERRNRRNRFAGLTVSGLALVVAVIVMTILAGVEGPYVGEGEVLLATDPVVVRGAASPEPQFDTSGLGIEEPLSPLMDIAKALEVVRIETEDGQLIRVTTIGTTVGGHDAIVLHYEGTVFSGRRLQLRCLLTSPGGGSCGGHDLQNVINEPGGLVQPESPTEPNSYEVGVPGVLMWDAPPGTSIVVLTVNGEPKWQRPIGGVAVFDTNLVDGDRFTLAALDEYGDDLRSFAITARMLGPSS